MSTDAGVRADGGVRVKGFFVVVVPCVIAIGGILTGIVLGWFSVAVASARPLDLATARGSADSLSLTVGTDVSLTGLNVTGPERAVAVVHVQQAELGDLCLVPRVTLPFLGRLGSLRIATGRTVRLGDATLAAAELNTGDIAVPRMQLGGLAGTESVVGAPGSFGAVASGDGADLVEFHELGSKLYGLTLKDGLSLSSLRIHASLGDQHC